MAAGASLPSYKELLKKRIADARRSNSKTNLRALADFIPIQYTFLSKILNDEQSHLSEDALYRAGLFLKLDEDELETWLLLRSFSISKDRKRRDELYRRIEVRMRSKVGSATVVTAVAGPTLDEIQYMLTPLASVLNVGIQASRHRKDPRRLASEIGLSFEQFKAYMRLLERNGFVELERNEWTIRKVTPRKAHFGRGHPVMRAHQMLMKMAALQKMAGLEDQKKVCLVANFTMDDQGFEEIRGEYDKLLRKAQEISGRCQHTGVYHLSLDLLRWDA